MARKLNSRSLLYLRSVPATGCGLIFRSYLEFSPAWW